MRSLSFGGLHQGRVVPHAKPSCLPARPSVRIAAKRVKKDLVDVDSEKSSNIKDIMKALNDKWGKGTIVQLDGGEPTGIMTTPSGCLPLDAALGGGYPIGRVVEIFGPESSGKTTLALHAIAEAQKAGKNCVFIDAEHALDKKYAQALGINTKTLMLVQPDCGEQALEIADCLARSCDIGLIVVDSVSALVPRVELEGEIGTVTVGAQARLMSSAMRKLCGSLSKGNTTIIFLNQIRMKVGVIYGNPEITSGGNALKYYASVRVDIRKKEAIMGDKGEVVGNKVRAKVVKNKVGPPYREANLDIRFGLGVDEYGALFDAAELCGVIERRGSYYHFGANNENLAQGRENALARVRAEQPLKEQLERAVKDALAGNASSAVLTSADDAGPDDEFEGVEFPVPAGTG